MIRPKHMSFVAVLTCVAFLNVTLLTTNIAFAQNKRTVACFVLEKNSKQLQAAAVMSSILRDNVGQMVGVELKTGAPAGNPQAAIEATRHTNAGFVALNTNNKAKALADFQKANELLNQNPGVGSIRLHARVAKGMGVANFLNNETTLGKDLIKRSLLLYSAQSANEYAYSVDIRNIYEHAKREIADLATGNIEVQSTPEGAEVFLNGEFKGYTPMTLDNAAAGSHLVEVRKDGYLRWSAPADVPEGGRAPVSAILTAAPNQGALYKAVASVKRSMKSAKKFGSSSQALSRLVGAKEILVVTAGMGGAGFELRGYFRGLDGTVKPVKGTIAQDANFFRSVKSLLTNAVQAAFAPDERAKGLDAPPAATVESVMKESAELGGEMAIDPDSPLFNLDTKTQSESIVKKWWFWTIIGSVVVGATATVLLLTMGEENETTGPVGNLNITLEQF